MAVTYGQYGHHRWLEIIPGALSWGILGMAILLSFVAPLAAVVFIIIFDLYWMLRVFYFALHVIVAYRTYRKTLAVNWDNKLRDIPHWERIHHLIMLPTYREDLPILETALESLAASKYPQNRMIVVIGGEERDQERFQKNAEILSAKFKDSFAELLFTVHPKDLPGEIAGKGSNLKWMGNEVKKLIDADKIPYDDIIVSAFDVDTVAHPQYFAHLAYTYLTVPNPTRSSYQPVTVFSNNIWNATAPVRIAAFGTTFWLLSELVRPERLWTFSSHSMPWRMLVDVGFWEPDLVSEDSRIFMQAFLHYDGDYRVTPIFLPVSMDTVTGRTYIESLVALYKQQRRWAWGVEHFPYMVTKFRQHPKISKLVKATYLFNHLEGMFTWATAPLLIFFLGYLPFWTIPQAASAFFVNSPYTLEWMMRGATLGVFVTGGLSFFMLPPRPGHLPRWNWIFMLVQWALMPVTFVLLGSLPALESQTRFMLGKYLGFDVTKKSIESRGSKG